MCLRRKRERSSKAPNIPTDTAGATTALVLSMRPNNRAAGDTLLLSTQAAAPFNSLARLGILTWALAWLTSNALASWWLPPRLHLGPSLFYICACVQASVILPLPSIFTPASFDQKVRRTERDAHRRRPPR